MNWKNIGISLVAAGIVGLIVSQIVYALLATACPAIVEEYKSGLFRPWNDPLMSYVFVHPFVVGFLMAVVFDCVRSSFKQEAFWKKGLFFGFLVWLVSTVPGMLMTLSSFNVSYQLVSIWTVNGLVNLIVAGIVISWVYHKWK